jgi:cytoskeletal protein CcmA (bactofilin family)
MRSRSKGSTSLSNKVEPAPAAPLATAEKRQSLIGASLQFVGEIRSTGSVRIEGRVTGPVNAYMLTVAPGGEIAGPVVAQMAHIDGRVDGRIEADSVVLGPNAQVVGDITHRSLAMEPGACFEGRSILSRPAEAEPAPEPGPVEPGPVEPGPVEPGPVELDPGVPDPAEPDHAAPDHRESETAAERRILRSN